MSAVNGCSRAERSSGFTLLEMIVALTILGLLSIVLMGGVRYAVASWTRVEVATSEIERLASIRRLLHHQLNGIYPLFNGSSGRPAVDFEGRPQEMRFLTSMPQVFDRGLARLQLKLEHAGERAELIITGRPELYADSGPGRILDQVFLGPGAARFAYFGSKPRTEPPRWHDEWRGMAVLPTLIRIAIDLDDRHAWFPLFVAPRITLDAGCRYEPSTAHCRGR